jgi:hypothetical protein
MDQYLEEPDGRLTLDEVLKDAPVLGWELTRDQYRLVSEEEARGQCGLPAGLNRVLTFESKSPRVALAAFFDPGTAEMLGMQYEHLMMEGAVMTVPNTFETVPSPGLVQRVIACWVEWFSDLSEAERRWQRAQSDVNELP